MQVTVISDCGVCVVFKQHKRHFTTCCHVSTQNTTTSFY